MIKTLKQFLVAFFMLIGLQYGANGAEVSPVEKLEEMLKSDFAGDPSIRLQLSFRNAIALDTDGKPSQDLHGIAFGLDADSMSIATEWKIDKNSLVCDHHSCTIKVQFQVIAITKGYGVPSWDHPVGREIHPLTAPILKTVQYRFERTKQGWKISKFPAPFIQAAILRDFFENEQKATNSIVQPAGSDPRAIKNKKIILDWRERQLQVLRRLS